MLLLALAVLASASLLVAQSAFAVSTDLDPLTDERIEVAQELREGESETSQPQHTLEDQFIPLIVGIATLIFAVYIVKRYFWHRRERWNKFQ